MVKYVLAVEKTLGIEIICKAIQRVQEDYPRIQFHLFSGNEQDVTDRLEKGLIDFGVIIEPANIYKIQSFIFTLSRLMGNLHKERTSSCFKRIDYFSRFN